MKDRRKEFIDNNLTLCEENCNLIDYDCVNKKAKCSCEIKISFPIFSNITFDKEKLKNDFLDINNIANIQFLKCYKRVFKMKDMIHNYGFFILDAIIFLFIICFILFYSIFFGLLIQLL